MRIVITGAAGGIGSQAIEELEPLPELRLIDVRAGAGGRSFIADLKNPSSIPDRSGFTLEKLSKQLMRSFISPQMFRQLHRGQN